MKSARRAPKSRQMPSPLAGGHSFYAAFLDLVGEYYTEAMPREPDSLVADVNAVLMEQILHIPRRQRKTVVKHQGQPENLKAGFEVLEGTTFGHSQTLTSALPRLKLSCFDGAPSKDRQETDYKHLWLSTYVKPHRFAVGSGLVAVRFPMGLLPSAEVARSSILTEMCRQHIVSKSLLPSFATTLRLP